MDKNQTLREIPKVDALLDDPAIREVMESRDRSRITELIRTRLERLRGEMLAADDEDAARELLKNLVPSVAADIEEFYAYHLRPVINATGTILHTNLGRAPVSAEYAGRLTEILTGYSNLEYNLETGARGQRYDHFEKWLCQLTGAESGFAVNNNAASVILILSTLAKGKEVIVSRGELVEIGGQFRIPDVMELSGAELVEVGTTNKTRIEDYENAITERTALLLKVHTSNYQIVGFSESVGTEELAALGKKYNIPTAEDLGSGAFVDLREYGLGHEPMVQESVKAGIDIVCFSGDKLLGGPQAGLIVGGAEYIDLMKKNPLTRALRIGKYTAAALEALLGEYLTGATDEIPILRMLSKTTEETRADAEELCRMLEASGAKAEFSVKQVESQVGGGAMPMERILSSAVTVRPLELSAAEFERRTRRLETPIIVRISGDEILLDVRTVRRTDFSVIAEELSRI